MARAANINMERESLTGRGLLDFKFSRGHEFNVLVEVKLGGGFGVHLSTFMACATPASRRSTSACVL